MGHAAYDIGFATDESPDLSPLLAEAIASTESLDGCAVVLLLTARAGSPGFRTFYSAASPTSQPELRIRYTPPTTSAQVDWTADKSCAVTVAIPTSEASPSSCAVPADAAASKPVFDTSTCPHLKLEASAATSGPSPQQCEMRVNGLDLFGGCGLDKLVVGRDGVCAAVVDPPNQPRAQCFDTKTGGVGAEQLATWIERQPQGASVMVVSCSRLAWAHNRDNLTSVLATLGAASPPTSIDDAYALIGVKGGAAPLSEARTPCCDNPDPVCHTCDQTLQLRRARVCGAAAASRSSRPPTSVPYSARPAPRSTSMPSARSARARAG